MRVVVPLLLAAMAVAGCGGDEAAEEQPIARHTAANGDVYNDADVAFATETIPHHAAALQLVVLTDGRPLDPEVEALAVQIRDEQVPRVEQLTDWLVAWDEEVPETSLDHVNAGHGDDHLGATEELAALQEASDAEFQGLWLDAMAAHLEDGVALAEAEQEDGAYAAAVDLAGVIADALSAQVDTIESLRD